MASGYTKLDVPTTFGDTHVIASGSEVAPPVVLLHAFFATAMSWYATVGALAEHHRVFAVDIMGEANRSRPTGGSPPGTTTCDGSANWLKASAWTG